MAIKTSEKLKIVLEVVQGSHARPAMALQTAEVSLGTLIPEVQALEAALEAASAPQDAAPSPLDELRKQQQELREKLQEGLTGFRRDVAAKLREAAQSINPED